MHITRKKPKNASETTGAPSCMPNQILLSTEV
jgi:hypothetical protein